MTLTQAQWQMVFIICGFAFIIFVAATYVICHILTTVVRQESLRIERHWHAQRAHDQEAMLAESERLLRATAARRVVLDGTLDELLPHEAEQYPSTSHDAQSEEPGEK